MNKTLNINLGGFIFHIDEDAYHQLERYLARLKQQFSSTNGGQEIIADIESRLAELFKERTAQAKEVITTKDVEEVITIMGKPEDYLYDEEEIPEDKPFSETTFSSSKRIFRDGDNRVIGGVSSGLAAYFNIDPLWIRLLFVVLFFSGPGFFIYLVMWLVIPRAKTTAEKLQMRGKSVNVTTIRDSIQEEMHAVGNSAKNLGTYPSGRSSQRVGGFFSDLGQFIRDAFSLIFRVLFKLIGVFFLIIGFIILLAIAGSLFAGGVTLMHSSYSIDELMNFLQMVVVNEWHYDMLLAGIVLSVIAPLFLLIYFGIRLLFSIDPLNKPTRAALALSTFIGLLLLAAGLIRIGMNFETESYVAEELALSGEHYYLTAAEDSISESFLSGEQGFWLPLADGSNAFDHVDIDVRQSRSDKGYIEITKYAHGRNYREAKNMARNYRYELQIQDSTIRLPLYLMLAADEVFRAQEVEVVMYLPTGSSVYIDDRLTPYLDDVKNLQNEWDLNMGDQRWIMTERGLSCEGCPEASQEWQEDQPQEPMDTTPVSDSTATDQQVALMALPASGGACNYRIEHQQWVFVI